MIDDEVITGADNEELKTSSDDAALVAINTDDLNKESLALLNKIIAENDVEKTKDLTYLFNANQNKKTMVRMDKLNTLQDNLVAQFAKRIAERPDEIATQELMQALKIVQDILERGQKQVAGTEQKPLIQVNNQTNTVNVGDSAVDNLSRESKEKVKRYIASVLNNIKQDENQDDIIDMTEKESDGEEEC